MENYYYLVPLTSAFGNLALFIQNSNRLNEINRILLPIYATLIFTNLISIWMFFADNPDIALFRLYVLRHFLFLLPFFLLQLTGYLTGRNHWNVVTKLFLGIVVLAVLFAEVTYWFNLNFLLIQEMKLRPWGYFPVLKPAARILLTVLFVGSWLISIYWFIKPIKRIDFFSYNKLKVFFILWWASLMLNMIPLSGYNLYPLGNGFDSIASILFSTYIHKRRLGFSESLFLSRISEVCISLSAGIIMAFLSLSFVPGLNETIVVIIILFSGIVSLLYLEYLKTADIELELHNKKTHKDLKIPNLSKQENRICELILEGYRRSDLLVFLNISDGTLRNHLSSIYSKTIANEKNPNENRDQFQRLTVYLHKNSKS